ncbi:fructosamine kinase family protein [Pasteurella bettyae]|uniref:Fructosamine kinase n=1 Tax=Pasteurella bettyae CCUG 2042 TaxID=1095749 RepID=I3DIG3_9PAST|nr:fructosamine kinase family protein [Pasteurella bettyae]EIJ71506.1 fructosamine kinase [Pasteurella bettyae CCUG 2042]SUB21629.1 fructosamine kinase [Pasteurella bettyae]
MWKSISQTLAEQFGAYYNIKDKEKIHTGEVHEAWLISDGVQPVFVKMDEKSYRSMFRSEADQLQLLARTKTVSVPQVYGIGCSQNHSFILLEALPLAPITDTGMSEFGVKLAKLHAQHTSESFGLDFDTWLGPLYQPNDWKTNWATFFSDQRIGWQLQICKEKGIEFGDIPSIVKMAVNRLAKHKPQPSLLHGNLWIENCGEVNGEIYIYDPACYWGDRECDLAFTEIFEPFPQSFYDKYNETYPLDMEGYRERKPLYQLYYLINFSHRFKGHYITLTQKLLNFLMSEEK